MGCCKRAVKTPRFCMLVIFFFYWESCFYKIVAHLISSERINILVQLFLCS